MLIILLIAVIAGQTLKYFHVNLDDKYILYKYAQNLANGYGLCFNIGQKVEGFTSFLFVLIVAVFIKCGNLLDQSDKTLIIITAIARLISYISTLGTLLYLSYFMRRYLQFPYMTVILTLLLLIFRSDFIFSSVNGLETGMFIFLFTGFNVHFLLSDRACRRSHRFMYTLFGSLASLCRADGFVYITIIITISLALNYTANKHEALFYLRRGLNSFFTLFLVVASYFVFRLWYFNDVFPNTYYVKVHSLFEKIVSFNGPVPRLIEGWERMPIVFGDYIWPCMGSLITVSFLYLLVIHMVHIPFLGKKVEKNRYVLFLDDYKKNFYSDKNKVNGIGAILISTLIFMSYTMYIGGDWMPGYRIIMHYFPLPFTMLCALIVDLVTKLIEKFENDIAQSFILLFFLSIFYLKDLANIDASVMNLSRTFCQNGLDGTLPENHGYYILKDYKNLRRHFLMYAGFIKELKSRMQKGDCIAFYEIGCTSFQLGTDYHVIDIAFLNDNILSRIKSNEGHYSMCNSFIYDATNEIRGDKDRYILARKPVYIIFDTFVFFTKAVPDRIFEDRYELVNDFPYNVNNFFTIYRRIGN